MNPTKLKLTNPTDDELSAAVAEYGWCYGFEVVGEDRCVWWENGKGQTLTRPECIALLRANGIEVEVTP